MSKKNCCCFHSQTWLFFLILLVCFFASLIAYEEKQDDFSFLATSEQCSGCYNAALTNPDTKVYFAHCQCFLEKYAENVWSTCSRNEYWLSCVWPDSDSNGMNAVWSNETVYQKFDFTNFTEIPGNEGYSVDDGGLCTPLPDLNNMDSAGGVMSSEGPITFGAGLVILATLLILCAWPFLVSSRAPALCAKLNITFLLWFATLIYLSDIYSTKEMTLEENTCLERSIPHWLNDSLAVIFAVLFALFITAVTMVGFALMSVGAVLPGCAEVGCTCDCDCGIQEHLGIDCNSDGTCADGIWWTGNDGGCCVCEYEDIPDAKNIGWYAMCSCCCIVGCLAPIWVLIFWSVVLINRLATFGVFFLGVVIMVLFVMELWTITKTQWPNTVQGWCWCQSFYLQLPDCPRLKRNNHRSTSNEMAMTAAYAGAGIDLKV